jgi:hypothetical protein
MKSIGNHLYAVLAFVLLICISAPALNAQTVSPRTGEAPKQQVITQAEFDRQPPEIQAIIKNNPLLYAIKQDRAVISMEELNALPAEKQQYIKSHPELYDVPGQVKKKEVPIELEPSGH